MRIFAIRIGLWKQSAAITAVFFILTAYGASTQAAEAYVSHGMSDASPSEVYLAYLEVTAELDSPQQVIPFSPHPRAELQAELAQMSEQDKAKTVAFIRSMAATDVEILDEQIDGDTATLEVRGQTRSLFTGEIEPSWGTVTLVRRGSEWKVKHEAWRDRPEASD